MNVTWWLVRAAGAIVLLHVGVLACPAILFDDFHILDHAATWADTRAGLWVPQNEHAMPLGRLTSWALVQLAPDARFLAYFCSLQGLAALLLAVPLVYLFVAREVESRPVGVAAAFLFGVNTVY